MIRLHELAARTGLRLRSCLDTLEYTAGNGIRVLYNVTRVPTALRITYHVDTRYMHAWYALETQCNGRIVTRGRETTRV